MATSGRGAAAQPYRWERMPKDRERAAQAKPASRSSFLIFLGAVENSADRDLRGGRRATVVSTLI